MLIDGPHPASIPEDRLLAECDLTRGRSSGPGGQHRNKVETLVTLRHLPTGIEAHAGERRSPEQNRRVALFRLRLALAVHVRAAVPIGDARSELWRARVVGGRIACSDEHRDYPAMLAEAMDMLEACAHDPRSAAIRLVCTTSQLVRLIAKHPPALARVNEVRADAHMHPLR